MDFLLLFGFIYFLTTTSVDCIKCYVCDNAKNLACGLEFKTYQFDSYTCPGPYTKCGKQTQMPLEDSDNAGWVGVIRSCYIPGSLPGINETNGCHLWTNADNFTALYCFCDEDQCNGSNSPYTTHWIILVISIFISALHLFMQS